METFLLACLMINAAAATVFLVGLATKVVMLLVDEYIMGNR